MTKKNKKKKMMMMMKEKGKPSGWEYCEPFGLG